MRSLFVIVIKLFFQKKNLIALFSMVVYTFLMVSAFYFVGLWEIYFLKDTIYWFFGVAFIMLMNINTITDNEHFFKSVILDNVKLIILLEFVVNLYVFNIVIELILVPVLFIIAGMSAIAENDNKYCPVKTLLDYMMMIFGFWVLIHVSYSIIIDYLSFINKQNLIGFFLPFILTSSYLPFIYFLALYVTYDGLFIRIEYLNKNKPYVKTIKRKILILCNINLPRIKMLRKSLGLLRFENEDDFLLAIQNFKNHS
ncbi:hypothetical protein KKA87_05400 [bacterium]|nr:hypothetical protein [bacterium]MBU1994776.1 hypothetical protein [bacterium]